MRGVHGNDNLSFLTILNNVLTVGESLVVKSNLGGLALTQEDA
jgi:hypothetical protein